MEIYNFSEPFKHTIIYNFYTRKEQDLIWEELEFLNKPGKLLSPDKTSDPLSSKNKKGIFLDNLYKQREISNILTLNRKIFNLSNALKSNDYCKYIEVSNIDYTMISYYENESYYLPHHDKSIITSVTTFWRMPKMFDGGDLKFPESNYIPKMDHNTMIIFPSHIKHEVTPVIMNENDGIHGRYTINQFFLIDMNI